MSNDGVCSECKSNCGFHASSCSHKPKRGNQVCKDAYCNGWNGWHSPNCQTRGYQTTSAPRKDPITQRGIPAFNPPAAKPEPEMCCGGTCVRALCMFHGSKSRP